MNKPVIAIFEEYCDLVKLISEDSVEVAVRGKYFTELYTRVMLQGWACTSIVSDDHDNHIARFTENGPLDMFDEMMGDEFKDDDSDWWKHKD